MSAADRRKHDAKYRVDPETGCWLWTGHVSPEGYGKYGIKYAHRLMYERYVGPIPVGRDIDHLCRVRRCCNPDHLEAVTRTENIMRGDMPKVCRARAAAITHCPHGHPYTPDNLLKKTHARRSCKACHRYRAAVQRAVESGRACSVSR